MYNCLNVKKSLVGIGTKQTRVNK